MINVNMLLATASSAPYTGQQLSVVLVACVLIGMFFGAITVNIFRKRNNLND